MAGYKENFVATVEDDVKCSVCNLPLREPVQTRCGHRFCRECLEEATRRYDSFLPQLLNLYKCISLCCCLKAGFGSKFYRLTFIISCS